LWWLAAATIPTGIAGLLLGDKAETWRNPYLIGGMLISVAMLMAYAEKVGQRRKKVDGMSFTDAMLIGLAQPLALVPGTSRSGITIVVGLLRHVDRYAAARFSFLLSTPAVGAAAAKAGYDLYKQGGVPPDLRAAFITGILVSAITGCLVIKFLLRYFRDHGLTAFVYYRLIFGIIVIALAIFLRQPAG
jgi:undecaprenyl-diphosphatase